MKVKFPSTNKMITDVDKKYGVNSKETLLMRLYVLSLKTNGAQTYNSCLDLYIKLMKKKIDK